MSYLAIVPHRVPLCHASGNYFLHDGYLSVETLVRQLSQWREGSIENIDLIGGEVSRLDSGYLSLLITGIRKFYTGEITVYTDLSDYLPVFDDPTLRLSIFWNSKDLEKLQRISLLARDVELWLLNEVAPQALADIVNPISNVTSIHFPRPADQALFRARVEHPDPRHKVIFMLPNGELSYGR